MNYATLIVFLSFLCSAARSQDTRTQDRDQVRLTAIQHFSKTKLFKRDSVFFITSHDTFYRVATDTISKNNYRSKRGKAYPNIIVVDILGNLNPIPLDTTKNINSQPWIPSRYFEQNGKLFIWWSKHDKLTDSTINVLDRYHLLVRCGPNDLFNDIFMRIDDAKQAATYFFCRNNFSVYKKIITNVAVGYYDPPNLKCE